MLQKRPHKLTLRSNLALALCCWLSLVGFAFAYASPGNPVGFVNDFALVLSSETKTSLETELSAFAKSTGNEISVVTIQSLDGDAIENYANTLFREWGIGSKDKNNGAILLIAVDDHKLRIEVGYGLEGDLTDIYTKRIQENTIVPRLKENNFDAAVVDGVHAILGVFEGETPPAPENTGSGFLKGFAQFIPFLIFFGLQFLFGILAPSKSWWLGGVLGGVVGGVIGFVAHSLLWFVISGVSLAGLGLIFDYLVSKAYQARGKNRHDFWTRGGFWGGGLGGSGGGGGFGGFGGGSSGGGGSSSSW